MFLLNYFRQLSTVFSDKSQSAYAEWSVSSVNALGRVLNWKLITLENWKRASRMRRYGLRDE